MVIDPNQPGLLVERKELIAKLLATNVNGHLEKKPTNSIHYIPKYGIIDRIC